MVAAVSAIVHTSIVHTSNGTILCNSPIAETAAKKSLAIEMCSTLLLVLHAVNHQALTQWASSTATPTKFLKTDVRKILQ